MSSSLLPGLAVLSLLAMPALAKDEPPKGDKAGASCTLSVKKGDLVAQGRSLVIDGANAPHNALAIDGDVVVRAGSTVQDVVALRGKVTVEPGARVEGDLVALGGDVSIGKGATVAGDVTAIGGQLQAAEGATLAGDKNSISININGDELFRSLVGKLISGKGTRNCELRFTED